LPAVLIVLKDVPTLVITMLFFIADGAMDKLIVAFLAAFIILVNSDVFVATVFACPDLHAFFHIFSFHLASGELSM
jgi:membrane protein YqaA with SNARE-associated domain